MEDIESQQAIPWSREGISNNPNITIEYIQKHKGIHSWRFLSSNNFKK